MNRTPDQPQQLLDDLQAIQELLETPPVRDHDRKPVTDEEVPLLSDVVAIQPQLPLESAPPTVLDLAQLGAMLDSRLRAEASLILQQVVDDFMPQIEAEVRARLEARLDQLRRPPRD